VADVVRTATLGSYGVTGLRARGLLGGRLRWLGGRPAIGVDITAERLAIDLRISVAYGAPVAEVARQLDSAVRFAVSRAVEREVDRLSIYVGALRVDPAAEPPSAESVPRATESDAAPGTDS
jgi:uncharacterized alkaline shock family protein YloU